jgi:hypothetical protein
LDRESDESKVLDCYGRTSGNAIRSLTKNIGANMNAVRKAARIDDRILRAENGYIVLYSPVGKLGDNFVDNSAEARFKVA